MGFRAHSVFRRMRGHLAADFALRTERDLRDREFRRGAEPGGAKLGR